ncbi:MAG: 4-hydroxythreonine-4-phosphate dehydrogenase PdxA, partial [Pseudomonadota bacterium]
MTTSPPLVVTMGDPSGIGPEIVAKSFADGRADGCVVAGSVTVMRDAAAALGLELSVDVIGSVATARPREGMIEVIETTPSDLSFPMGEVSAASGKAAFDAIVAGIEL